MRSGSGAGPLGPRELLVIGAGGGKSNPEGQRTTGGEEDGAGQGQGQGQAKAKAFSRLVGRARKLGF